MVTSLLCEIPREQAPDWELHRNENHSENWSRRSPRIPIHVRACAFPLEIRHSVVAPVVAPAQKSRAVLCRAVPWCPPPANPLRYRLSAPKSASCRVVPRPAELCQKHPFLYGVQEVAGSNPAGPICSKLRSLAKAGPLPARTIKVHTRIRPGAIDLARESYYGATISHRSARLGTRPLPRSLKVTPVGLRPSTLNSQLSTLNSQLSALSSQLSASSSAAHHLPSWRCSFRANSSVVAKALTVSPDAHW
jgi:hypothetical protein